MNTIVEAEVFTPPSKSLASRDIPYRSNASCRSVVIAKTPALSAPRAFNLESRLEEKVFYLALADQRVYDIWEQPPAISFEVPLDL